MICEIKREADLSPWQLGRLSRLAGGRGIPRHQVWSSNFWSELISAALDLGLVVYAHRAGARYMLTEKGEELFSERERRKKESKVKVK